MTEGYWDPVYELMLEEARRSIDRQSERLQTVRERSVGLVGFGALVAAAFGLGDLDQPGPTGVVALLAFVAVASSALFVLYPREFRFELSARRIEAWLESPDLLGVAHISRAIAVHHDDHHSSNHKKLARMQAAIAVGVLALSVETVALVSRIVL